MELHDNKPELLAPAGSIEAMNAALKAGADAIYIGGRRFGARAYADNPDDGALLDAIDRVHLLGRRLYMTVNTLLKNDEIASDLLTWMEPFYLRGLDGVIVQDPGVVLLLREAFPGLELHASTQMAVTGSAGARMMKEAGICRVVPARELSLEEIRAIRAETGLEVECFIHGAMCYSYSGMCLMSSMIGGRSGNRGRCAGVCRLPFTVSENDRVIEGKRQNYPLNMKDLCAIELIPELIQAGCSSFKIEGRMKKPEYTAGVTSIYRKYIDRWAQDPEGWYVEPEDLRKLETLFNRDGLYSGYYKTRNGKAMIALRNRKLEEEDSRRRSSEAQREYAGIGQFLEQTTLSSPCEADVFMTPEEPLRIRLQTGNGTAIEAFGAVVQKAEHQPLSEERIEKQLKKQGEGICQISAVRFHSGKDPVFLPIGQINALRREALQMLETEILRAFHRDGKSQSDTVRTNIIEKTEASVRGRSETMPDPRLWKIWIQAERPEQIDALLDKDVLSLLPEKMNAGLCIPLRLADEKRMQTIRRLGLKVRIVLPWIIRMDRRPYIERRLLELAENGLDVIDGVLVRNLEGAGMMRSAGRAGDVILDAGLYDWNDFALLFYSSLGFHRNTIPLELNRKEILHRNNQDAELILYGRVPMMVSAQCVKKTMQQCTHQNVVLHLTDRKHADFPVVCECEDCCNVIYNSLPSSLTRQWADTASVSRADAFRIIFTTESRLEMEQVLQTVSGQYQALLDRSSVRGRGESEWKLPFSVTAGHYRRGVL